MKRCFDGTHFTEIIRQKLVALSERFCRNPVEITYPSIFCPHLPFLAP